MPPLDAPLRRLAGLVPALAMALAGMTAIPAPARADDELARLLAGAAGIVILYSLLDRAQRDRPVTSHPVPHCTGYCPPPHIVRPPVPRLPAHCAIQITDRQHGRNVYYGRRCLRQAGVDIRHLPPRCEAELRTRNVRRTLYRADCLGRAGFRTHPPHPGRHW